MARVKLPVSRLKARKRTRRVRIALVVFVFLFLIGAGTIALAHAPFWRIKNVVVSGAESIATTTIQNFVENRLSGSYAFMFPKDNILLYPKTSLRDALLTRFPALRSVTLRAQTFSTLAVDVVERKPHALWCGISRGEASSCLLLDDVGVAYGSAVSFSGSAYVRYYGASTGLGSAKQYLTEEKFHALDALALAIAQGIESDSLAYVEVSTEEDVHMGFKNGFEIIFSLPEDGAEVHQRFMLALISEPFKMHTLSEFEYLDLRFGDKLYYKLKD